MKAHPILRATASRVVPIHTMPQAATSAPTVVLGAIALLRQCDAFVRSLPDPAYTNESRTIRGGTIGKHVRHSLDHYAAAVAALTDPGVIDYDHRSRNVPMETSRPAALERVGVIQGLVEALDQRMLQTRVRVRFMVSGDGAEAELSSTLGRELAFASHHAVHHHAMMKAIAAEFGIETDGEFGKAPSTINFDRGPERFAGQGG